MPNWRIDTDSIVHMPHPRLSQRHYALKFTFLDHTVTSRADSVRGKFNKYAHLRKHVNSKHSGRRSPGEDEYSASRDDPNLPHKCASCPRRFTRYSSLKKHERATHRGVENPILSRDDPNLHFRCGKCGKFKRKSNLDRHMKKHFTNLTTIK
jgi:uncharacterized Zn-finger protein